MVGISAMECTNPNCNNVQINEKDCISLNLCWKMLCLKGNVITNSKVLNEQKEFDVAPQHYHGPHPFFRIGSRTNFNAINFF